MSEWRLYGSLFQMEGPTCKNDLKVKQNALELER